LQILLFLSFKVSFGLPSGTKICLEALDLALQGGDFGRELISRIQGYLLPSLHPLDALARMIQSPELLLHDS
jgi:hypothetical protein